MTVKECLNSYFWTMDTFQNPQNKCVEDLKLKYLAEDSNHEEIIPALDQRWCKKTYIFTLYHPPPTKNNSGEFTVGSKEDWIERVNFFIEDLKYLLLMPYHRFWSEVMYNKHCLNGLNSFLQQATPFYLRDEMVHDDDIIKKIKLVQKRVFLLLVRLTQSQESEKAWMKESTLGTILYDNFIISLPQLMDICLIYAQDNFKEVSDLINRVLEVQPQYMFDIQKSTSFVCEVLSRVENQLISPLEENGIPFILSNGAAAHSIDIVKLIYLLLDIAYSLSTFLQVCPKAGIVFHKQHLEPRISSFYDKTIPELSKHLDIQFNSEETEEDYKFYNFKLNLGRHQLISAVHGCLTPYLSSILEDRECITDEELKSRVDNYLNTVSDCLADHMFMRDYNAAFPVEREIKVLTDICPDIDSLKCDFIIESVLSLYDLPRARKPVVASASAREHVPEGASSNQMMLFNHSASSSKKVSGVELESLITEVKDILPHLGDGFVVKCLEHYNYKSADVVNAILEDSLPPDLASLDRDLPVIPPERNEEADDIPERINIYDNDEFDIMTQDRIDTSRIHKGKKPDKHKNLFELLDDKSHVNQLRDLYSQLSLVECLENANEYDDEYDDTYDDADAPVGNEGETEAEARRVFVTPRVLLQQQRKPVEEPVDFEDAGTQEEEEDENRSRADLFIENPADVRARAEQRRLEMRGRGGGRSRAAFPHRDVVGKPKGHGQEKEVVVSREFKNTNKAFRANHNRRALADRKKRQGMFPS